MVSFQRLKPWSFSAPKDLWFRNLGQAAKGWRPSRALKLDAKSVRDRIVHEAIRKSGWLLHPAVNVLTFPTGDALTQRDFQMAIRVAANCPDFESSVTVPHPLLTFGRAGGFVVPSGNYKLSEIVSKIGAVEWPFQVTLDVGCHSLGFVYSNSWASKDDLPDEYRQSKIRSFMRAIGLLESKFPECAAWVASVTRVVIPLCSAEGNTFHSSSTAELPGLVCIDISPGELYILEALVHESAHRHLYLHETVAPLIDPSHRRTYKSPLRTDLRPLRGIFLAYHALAYICAFYSEGVELGLIESDNPDLVDLHERLDDAEHTLFKNQQFITEHGCKLLSETEKVSSYAGQ